MKTLLENLNSGILEEKGIWREYFEPNSDELKKGLESVDFVKKYQTENQSIGVIDIYHVSILGNESIVIMKGDQVMKRITSSESVQKQVSNLDRIEFITDKVELI